MNNTTKPNTLLEVVCNNCISTYDMTKIEVIKLEDNTLCIELSGNKNHSMTLETSEQAEKLYRQLCEKWCVVNGYIQT